MGARHSFEPMDRNCFNPFEKENYFGDPCVQMTLDQQQPSEIFVESAQEDHIEFNITTGAFDSVSPRDTGIDKFKNRGQPNTNLDLDESQGPSTISDGVDSFSRHPRDPHEREHHLESSTSGMRFFDNRNEIDCLGN